jgi:hypothetical protein
MGRTSGTRFAASRSPSAGQGRGVPHPRNRDAHLKPPTDCLPRERVVVAGNVSAMTEDRPEPLLETDLAKLEALAADASLRRGPHSSDLGSEATTS